MAVWLVLPDYVKSPARDHALAGRPRRKSRVHWRIVFLAAGTAWLLVAGLVGTLYAIHHPVFPGKSAPSFDPVRLSALKEVLTAPQPAEVKKDGGGHDSAKEESPAAKPAAKPAEAPVVQKPILPASELPLEDDVPNWEKYGTQVAFVGNPVDAARQATKERKLLFVLHLSGNFEDKQFT